MGLCFEGGLGWCHSWVMRTPNESPILGDHRICIGLTTHTKVKIRSRITVSRLLKSGLSEAPAREETDEWIESLEAVLGTHGGPARSLGGDGQGPLRGWVTRPYRSNFRT